MATSNVSGETFSVWCQDVVFYQRRRFQCLNCQAKWNISDQKTSSEDFHPNILRGRVLICHTIRLISSSVIVAMSVPLGIYSLINPFVFSLLPLAQGA